MTHAIPMPVKLSVVLLAILLSFGIATAALAHGGGANGVDADAPNCMGQLARLHANGKDPGTNPDTMMGFGTDQPHPNLGGPYESIQEQAHAFQAYCGLR